MLPQGEIQTGSSIILLVFQLFGREPVAYFALNRKLYHV